MIKITMQQGSIEHAMQGPSENVTQAKAYMLANLVKYGFVKGVPVMVQVDHMTNNLMSYTLEYFSVTP